MKVTFVLQNADLAGGVRVVAVYAQRLMRRGHDVTVVSTPNKTLPLRSQIGRLARGMPWARAAPLGPSHLDDTGVRHHVIERYRPVDAGDVPDADVVIATTWQTGYWVAALPPSKGVKAHLMQHYETWAGPAERVDGAWRLPTAKITISRWLERLARERFDQQAVRHIPNSVDTDLFHAPARGKQVVPTVGMLYHDSPFKGIETALDAVRRARAEIPELRLVVFGREPVAQRHRGLFPDSTRYVLCPPQQTLRDLYAACDVWLCGSSAEGFHLPPLEAMACRTPVVSTRVGGPEDIIDEGVNGRLVEVGDSAGLARAALDVLWLDATAWRRMSDAALRTAHAYTWDDATDRFESALEEFCGMSGAIRRPPGQRQARALLGAGGGG